MRALEDRAQPGRARSAVPPGGRGGEKTERQQRSQNVTMLCRISAAEGGVGPGPGPGPRSPRAAKKCRGASAASPQSGGNLNEREMERERESRRGGLARAGGEAPQVTGGRASLAVLPPTITGGGGGGCTRGHLGPRRAVCRLVRDQPRAKPACGRARPGQATPGLAPRPRVGGSQ